MSAMTSSKYPCDSSAEGSPNASFVEGPTICVSVTATFICVAVRPGVPEGADGQLRAPAPPEPPPPVATPVVPADVVAGDPWPLDAATGPADPVAARPAPSVPEPAAATAGVPVRR